MIKEKSARLFFSEVEKAANVNLVSRLQNSTTGGDKGLGSLSRLETYKEVMGVYDNLKERSRKLRFSNSDGAGVADSASALSGVTAIDATIRAYMSSITGYFCKEVAISQANALVNHFDTLEIIEGTIISPNIGSIDKDSLKRSKIRTTVTVTADAFSLTSGKRLFPGSIKVFAYAGTTLVSSAIDNGTTLVAPAGEMTAAAINYGTGAISGTFAAALAVTSVVIEAAADITGDQKSAGTRNHVKGRMVGFIVMTKPELLTYESNLMQSIAVNKSLSIDMDVYLSERLAELYTVKINERVATTLELGYQGDTMAINMAAHTYDNVRSYSDYFFNQMQEAFQLLVDKAYRACVPNVVLVGKKAALPFMKCAQTGVFTRAKSNTLVGLIGYFDETIPVIRTDDVAENAGYIAHKSDDGEIAPLLRAIFLPLTTTPEVGNFDNPLQTTGGIFYQEDMVQLYPQMVQKFTIAGESSY